MPKTNPHLIVLSGPNGAGKSTIAPTLLEGALEVSEFVNADTIAQGISAFRPEEAAFQAGRVMLKRLRELADHRETFAFETTLASCTFATWIKNLQQKGYIFHLLFLWLSSPEVCKKRVADRVNLGGHSVPNNVIERRYYSGLRNFFRLYKPIANSWDFIDNSELNNPALIASNAGIKNLKLWNEIEETYHV